MKKILLSLLIICLAITMFGCNASNSKALNSLEGELENVESVVSSTNSSEVSDVSSSQIYNQKNYSIQNHRLASYENMRREEELRQQILSLNGYVKNNISKDKKLSKAELSALKNITGNLKKYASDLKKTKNEVKSTVNSIKKNSKKDSIEVESNYNSLNNSMNERYTYLLNIYNNLNLAHELVCDDDNLDYSYQSEENEEKEVAQPKKQSKKVEKKDKKGLKKNIDSYNPYKVPKNTSNNNYATPQNAGYNYSMPYYGMPNNGYYGMPYGFNGYGYNGYFNNQFNPSRNTDTFYPYGRNIDTYKFNPNLNNFGMNGWNKNGIYPAANIDDDTPQDADLKAKDQTDNKLKIENKEDDKISDLEKLEETNKIA